MAGLSTAPDTTLRSMPACSVNAPLQIIFNACRLRELLTGDIAGRICHSIPGIYSPEMLRPQREIRDREHTTNTRQRLSRVEDGSKPPRCGTPEPQGLYSRL